MDEKPIGATEPQPAAARQRSSIDGTIDHMEEEFLELEQKSRPRLAWAAIVLVLLGAAVGAYFWFAAGEKASALGPPVPITGVLIEISQPRNLSEHDAAPQLFAWESIASRHDYLFTLKREGEQAALVEHTSKTSTLRLTPEEAARIGSGNYAWTVRARAREGAILGTGGGRFRVR
jgi:hypothetical protein